MQAGGFRRQMPQIGPAEQIALGVSAIWLLLVLAFWLFLPGGEGGAASVLLTIVGVVLPLGLIWFAALSARNARALRQEAQELRAMLDSMRAAMDNRPEPKPADMPVATFTSHRAAPEPAASRKVALAPKPAPAEEQPGLALGTPTEAEPVSVSDFIRAMNFPDNAEDKEGFRALRRALEERSVAKLIRASQDVLTLLAQDGIYMDDLTPEHTRPELWRRFAQGERGREVASVGGVRDRSSLALTAGRLRADTIFRDAVHHFLRQFDRTFTEFERNASDQEVVDLADTRTARAFMLLGRAAGIFG
ncbi:hypothetical protein [Paenirhodobacter sp.]|uniref:hypothetical protein n=1 Tax=Paenirhodobacter sp. TaxID=1965326 RepID=UPI003B3D6D4E